MRENANNEQQSGDTSKNNEQPQTKPNTKKDNIILFCTIVSTIVIVWTLLFGDNISSKFCRNTISPPNEPSIVVKDSIEKDTIITGDKGGKGHKPNENEDPIPDTIVNIIPSLDTIYGEGSAVKSDSSRAWDTAYARGKNDLLEKLPEEEKINAKKYIKVDSAKSTKPFLTPDGWKATVVVFVNEEKYKNIK